MTSVAELEQRVADALDALVAMRREGMLPPVLSPLLTLAPPPGQRARVTLCDEDGRELRSDMPAREWNHIRGEVAVNYGPAPAGHGGGGRGPEPVEIDGQRLRELAEVMVQAERSPHLHFVALKFLRDRLLPDSGRAWTRSPDACQRAVAIAIDRGILSTTRKPNPRNPSFPVTAVELDRSNGMVAEVLERIGDDEPSEASDSMAADEVGDASEVDAGANGDGHEHA